ncbi:HNH endonuclease signature motif containing protein [Burkholderia territorii]|uniref:HNH endonuclease signature motif containing protein n=1 Tax=Burkholderia territorii TaxID=1503055 RepID=UPI0009BECB03|nr:HNH endonuclease signature motif containing protein [Burkholderia territorii]
MPTGRVFRKPESFEAERLSRDAIGPFLESRGFAVLSDERIVRGVSQAQVVTARSEPGRTIKMRVRLCWRHRGPGNLRFSAAQLRADLIDNDWDKTLDQLVDRDMKVGISHTLIFQRVGETVPYAALVPIDQLGLIWRRQAEVSEELIKAGRLGRTTKNHAKNGSSPTVYLMDSRHEDAHFVPDVLWQWPGVQDLVKMGDVKLRMPVDDTWDDLYAPDPSGYGSDGASERTVTRSEVKRDPRVRAEVVKRANGKCERSTCGAIARYEGFLDVHHILGVRNSDRVWNCVALCPSCHRDAHFAPERDVINDTLLDFASRFRK